MSGFMSGYRLEFVAAGFGQQPFGYGYGWSLVLIEKRERINVDRRDNISLKAGKPGRNFISSDTLIKLR